MESLNELTQKEGNGPSIPVDKAERYKNLDKTEGTVESDTPGSAPTSPSPNEGDLKNPRIRVDKSNVDKGLLQPSKSPVGRLTKSNNEMLNYVRNLPIHYDHHKFVKGEMKVRISEPVAELLRILVKIIPVDEQSTYLIDNLLSQLAREFLEKYASEIKHLYQEMVERDAQKFDLIHSLTRKQS